LKWTLKKESVHALQKNVWHSDRQNDHYTGLYSKFMEPAITVQIAAGSEFSI